ncbi:MAG: glycosyltransferase family 2 protein [Candidatus Binatia bacterium]|nr:glycosyltransferase family 2 protein [Candidatus Binatia bacterium]MDG2011820.1 glycosyltransferase family 2 protein [Candidatus Binatia bacterium]
MTRVWPKVSIGVVTCTGPALLEQCLGSLGGLDYPLDRIEVLIHDNGSPDAVAPWAARRHPAADVWTVEANRGFAGPCNGLVERARTDLVCLVNDDMTFDPGFLRALVEVHESTGAACVGACVLTAMGDVIEFAGGSLAFSGHAAPRRHGLPVAALEGCASIEDTLFASGGAMLVVKEKFIGSGGFDPAYFAYYEDVDLGWRLQALGESVVWTPEARCFHQGHASEAVLGPAGRFSLLERNALLSILKNFEPRNASRIFSYALALQDLRAQCDPDRSEACDRGRLGAMAALPEARRRGRTLAHRRRRSDVELMPLFQEPWRVEIPQQRYREEQQKLAREFGVLRWWETMCGTS